MGGRDEKSRSGRPLKICLMELWADPPTRNYTAPMANALAARDDVELHLLLNRRTVRSLYAFALARSAAKFFRAPVAYRPLLDLFLQPFEWLRLMATVLALRPSVVHFPFVHPWQTLMLPLLSLFFPVAVTWHDLVTHEGEEYLRKRLARWVLMKYSSILFVHSEESRQAAMERFGIAEERLAVTPMSTYEHWRTLGNDTVAEEEETFLFIGRILPYKAPEILFEAFRRVLKEHPKARLIVAGFGDLTPYESQLAAIEERVEIHNRRVPEEEAAALVRRAIAVILCHREVTQSAIIYTAAAFEKPVIASRIPGFEQSISDGKTGLLTTPEDPEKLAEAMAWMIEHPAERKALGVASRERTLEISGPDIVAERLMDGYRRICGERDP